MARLEEIVHALEAGNLSLDDSLRVFEEGTGLLRLCGRRFERRSGASRFCCRMKGRGRGREPFRWEEGRGVSFDLEAYFAERRRAVDEALDRYLPPATAPPP